MKVHREGPEALAEKGKRSDEARQALQDTFEPIATGSCLRGARLLSPATGPQFSAHSKDGWHGRRTVIKET